MARSIAVIPARGGSKRIPRKNILEFNGLPMIGWTIRAAIDSKLFEQIVVSTDDEEIAEISRVFGAEVPFKRKDKVDDYSSVSEAVITTVNQATEFYEKSFDNVVMLMPNCPLRDANDITLAWDYFLSNKHSFQISAFEFGWQNPWWAATLFDDGQPKPLFPDAVGKRSQDLEQLYCPTGAVWIAAVDKLLECNSFYGPGHVFFPMKWQSSLDIDEWPDFEFAQLLAKRIEG